MAKRRGLKRKHRRRLIVAGIAFAFVVLFTLNVNSAIPLIEDWFVR